VQTGRSGLSFAQLSKGKALTGEVFCVHFHHTLTPASHKTLPAQTKATGRPVLKPDSYNKRMIFLDKLGVAECQNNSTNSTRAMIDAFREPVLAEAARRVALKTRDELKAAGG
jgi:hypothetical protein